MLPETLDKLLGTSLTLIAAIIGLYVVVRFIRRDSHPFPVEIANHIVLAAFLGWFAAYAIATNLELDAMRKVFDRDVLPGLSVSYGLLALAFSVCFSLLIITHRNLFLAFPIVMLLGFSDLIGNLNLMSGMQHIVSRHLEAQTVPSEPARIWISYYLSNNHFLRIAIYMLITYAGFMIFLASRIGTYSPEPGGPKQPGVGPRALAFFKRNRISLEVVGKLVFVTALIFNEVLIWGWRIDREREFVRSGNQEHSGYVEWSVSGFYKFRPDDAPPPQGQLPSEGD
jgi:hypothetical protein